MIHTAKIDCFCDLFQEKSYWTPSALFETISAFIPDEISETEIEKLKFLFPVVKKSVLDEVIKKIIYEIDSNVLNIEDDQRLKRYMIYLEKRLSFVTEYLDIDLSKERPDKTFANGFKLNNRPNTGYEFLCKMLYNPSWFSIACYRIRECLEGLKEENGFVKKPSLSSFEVALRHWYLVKAGIEPYIIPRHVAIKYKGLGNFTNIQTSYSQIDKNPPVRIPNLNSLKNVLKSLEKYPEAQKLILIDIENLKS